MNNGFLLNIDPPPNVFENIIDSLKGIDVRVSEVITNHLIKGISDKLEEYKKIIPIRSFKVELSSSLDWLSLADIVNQKKITFHYLKIIIDFEKGYYFEEGQISSGKILNIPKKFYGMTNVKFSQGKLKTKERYIIEIKEFYINQDKIFEKRKIDSCVCNEENLSAIRDFRSSHFYLLFGCVLCGKEYFCDCFENQVRTRLSNISSPQYCQDTVSQEVDLLNKITKRKKYVISVRMNHLVKNIFHGCMVALSIHIISPTS